MGLLSFNSLQLSLQLNSRGTEKFTGFILDLGNGELNETKDKKLM